MRGDPPPLPWERLEFWLVVFAISALIAIARLTWRRDESERALLLRRVVLGAAAIAIVAHLALAWDAWAALAGRNAGIIGAGAGPWGPPHLVVDALIGSAVVVAAFTYTVGLAAIFRRPPPGAPDLPWKGLAFFGGMLIVGWLVPMRLPPRWVVCGLSFGFTPEPLLGRRWTWDDLSGVGYACAVGSVAAILASLVVLQIVIVMNSSRNPPSAARRETLRDGLLLWGFLLLAGSALFLEWRAVEFVAYAEIGARAPVAWDKEIAAWLAAHSIPLAFAFAGFVAACFGGLHLARPGPRRADTQRAPA